LNIGRGAENGPEIKGTGRRKPLMGNRLDLLGRLGHRRPDRSPDFARRPPHEPGRFCNAGPSPVFGEIGRDLIGVRRGGGRPALLRGAPDATRLDDDSAGPG